VTAKVEGGEGGAGQRVSGEEREKGEREERTLLNQTPIFNVSFEVV
jgi:hypothetical protein